MRPGTSPALSTALRTSLVLLAGRGSSSQPPAESTSSPAAEGTAGKDTSDSGEQLVTDEATSSAQKDDGGTGPKADSISAVERKVGAAVESVMGHGACSERKEFAPGTPLDEWSRLIEDLPDDGLFGPWKDRW